MNRKTIHSKSWLIILIILIIPALLLFFKARQDSENLESFFQNIILSNHKNNIEKQLVLNLTNVYNSSPATIKTIADQKFTSAAAHSFKDQSHELIYPDNTFDGALKLSFKENILFPIEMKIKFRFENNQNHYLLTINKKTTDEIILSKIINGKKEILIKTNTLFPIINENPNYNSLYIYFFKKYLLLMHEDKILAFFDCLEPKTAGKIIVSFSGSENDNQMNVKFISIDSLLLTYLENDLMSLKILPEPSSYHWNIYYPEHLLDIDNHNQELYQRVEIGDITKPSLLLPIDEKAQFDARLMKDSKFRVSIALVNKYIYDPEKIIFQIKVKSKNELEKVLQKKLDRTSFLKNKWEDMVFDLRAFSGKTVTISMESFISGKRIPTDSNITTIWGNPEITEKKEKHTANVIIFILDAVRPDHLSCYGYERNTSPNIDNLAQNGVIFYSAVTAAPWTLPSHMSIFTGLYPSECGYNTDVMNRNIMHQVGFPRLKSELLTLAEYLSSSGYATAAITGGGMLKPEYNFDQGFRYFEHQNKDKSIVNQISSMSKLIEKYKDNKFFILLHTYETHCPYSHKVFNIPKNATSAEKAISAYDSGIRYTDNQIGLVIEQLKKENIYDDSLVIIMSDHGENFSKDLIGIEEDNYCGSHGTTLYDTELKIPLIFSGGAIDAKQKNIHDQVRTVDLMPTILDFLGIESMHPIQGRSILSLIDGKSLPPIAAYSEGIRAIGKTTVNKYSIRTLKYKLILNIANPGGSTDAIGTSYEFYNLVSDPLETTDIQKEQPSSFNKFKILLESIRAKLHYTTSSVNYDSIRDLKNLGYIDN